MEHRKHNPYLLLVFNISNQFILRIEDVFSLMKNQTPNIVNDINVYSNTKTWRDRYYLNLKACLKINQRLLAPISNAKPFDSNIIHQVLISYNHYESVKLMKTSTYIK